MTIRIRSLDHIVLTVHDIDAAVAFYRDVLGCEEVVFGGGRRALRFGSQKINLHPAGHEFEPKARTPLPGSADLCFLTATPLGEAARELELRGIRIIEGPVRRTGACGPLLSLYVRDPDGNLVEISNPAAGS